MKTKSKKLELNRTTIRFLSDEEMKKAAGGAPSDGCTVSCHIGPISYCC